MQSIMCDLYAHGPDWPIWTPAEHWRQGADPRGPFAIGDDWATRMEGAIYLVSWEVRGWALYRYCGEPNLGTGERIRARDGLSRKQIEEAMRWIMETLPARVIQWTLV
jgi:hypothetical protein